MALTDLITTDSLQEIKISEQEIVNNLYIHANSSLSKAHGWEFILLPNPFLDAYGNNLSTYQDSGGDIAGHYQLRLTHAGINYYAPLESSTLAGQDPNTNLTISQASALATQSNGGTAWITTFSSQAEAVIASANTGVLIPHTLLGHWEAHTGGIYAVIPQVTYDSAGHVVGNYIARIGYNGQELWIPCEPRLGGPLQPPRLAGFDKASPIEITSGGGDTGDYNVPFTPVLLGGTLPITYSYEYWDSISASWRGPIAVGPVDIPWVQHTGNSLACSFVSATTGEFLIIHGGPGGDDTDEIRLRCTATGPGGSTHTSVLGSEMVMRVIVHDHAACCWFCSEANIVNRITPEQWQVIGKVEQHVFRLERRGLASYIKHGNRLVMKMKEQGVQPDYFVNFTQTVLSTVEKQGYKAAAEYYINFVASAVRTYWPETNLRGFKQGLVRLHARQGNLNSGS